MFLEFPKILRQRVFCTFSREISTIIFSRTKANTSPRKKANTSFSHLWENESAQPTPKPSGPISKPNLIVMDGIFAVSKPSGPSSAEAVSQLKNALNKSMLVEGSRAWLKANGINVKKRKSGGKKSQWWSKKKGNNQETEIKVGHGGTLDPLASGVMVIGIGEGTKKLVDYLTNCTKVYQATAVFGASTTTYDVTGNVLEYFESDSNGNNIQNIVTVKNLQEAIKKNFSGEIVQYPPVYSALKMNGKPLYEYAREGVPLPKKIESRTVTIDFFNIVPDSLRVLKQSDTLLKLPEAEASEGEKKFYLRETMPPVSQEKELPSKTIPEFFVEVKFQFSVSSGTYIRSLIHDLAQSLGTVAYMSSLERIKQGGFELSKNVFDLADITGSLNDTEWVPMVKKMLMTGPEITINEIKQTTKPIELSELEVPREITNDKEHKIIVQSFSPMVIGENNSEKDKKDQVDKSDTNPSKKLKVEEVK